MASIHHFSLGCKPSVKFDFNGGNLTSDAGILALADFLRKLDLPHIIDSELVTNGPKSPRKHTSTAVLMQFIFQVIAGYFEDACTNSVSTEPVLTTVFGKDRMASQSTMSRFFASMNEKTLKSLDAILRCLRKCIYSINAPEYVLLDLDSTHINTYGSQEKAGFNAHYRATGYHPLLLFDSLTQDLIKAELRPGTMYCGKDADIFVASALKELKEDLPETSFCFRADSGFAMPKLYEVLEAYDCDYVIRLKENSVLTSMTAEAETELVAKAETSNNTATIYGEFMYKAQKWSQARRVVFKMEKSCEDLFFRHTFIVTNLETLSPEDVIKIYCNRGAMENLIKEFKNGFDGGAVSSKSFVVNCNRFKVHALVYNIFNYFKRLLLPGKLKRASIDTIRTKLIKVAARKVTKARCIWFRICSSYPYKKLFEDVLDRLRNLNFNPHPFK